MNDLIDYTNRTTTFWDQGIFTHAAAGQTDFIDRDQVLIALNEIDDAVDQLEALNTQEINSYAAYREVFEAAIDLRTDPTLPQFDVSQLFYILTDLTTGLTQRGQLTGDGRPSIAALRPNTLYRAAYLDPATLSYGFHSFITESSGTLTPMPRALLYSVADEPDMDGDGLANISEAVIGTLTTSADSDGDGISDTAEVQQGTDPLDGLPVVTGIIASADTPGTAVDVCAVNDVAMVADSAAGVSVFSVVNGQNPVIIAQVDTPGDAQAVACAGDLIAVANGGGGLSIIDISDPPAAQIVHQLDLGGIAQTVTTAGGVAYVGLSTGQVVLIDLASGTQLDQVRVSGVVQDLAIAGGYLYILTEDSLHAVYLLDAELKAVGSAESPFAGTLFANRRLFVGVESPMPRTGRVTIPLA